MRSRLQPGLSAVMAMSALVLLGVLSYKLLREFKWKSTKPLSPPHNQRVEMAERRIIHSHFDNNSAQLEGQPEKINQMHAIGFELPFSLTHAAKITADTDLLINPRKLIDQWQAAQSAGHWSDAIAFRNQILEAGASIVPLLFDPLHHADVEVVCDTLRLLRQIGGPQATAMALGRIMSTSPDDQNYRRIIATMSEFDSRSAADWLVRELGRTTQQSTRETLLDMLASMGGNQAVASIAHGLRHAIDPLHRRDLITGLIMRSNPAAVNALTSILNQSAYRLPREAAARALATIGSREALYNLAEAAEYNDSDRLDLALQFADSTYAQEALIELALDSFWSEPVRVSAANGLASHSGYRLPVVLANALTAENETEVAAAMANTLQQTKPIPTSAGTPRQTQLSDSRGELWF